MFIPKLEEKPIMNKSRNGLCNICRQYKATKWFDPETNIIACSKCFGSNIWHAQVQRDKSKDKVDCVFEDMTLGVRRNVK